MFRQIGDDFYSCVAPAGYEKDRAVTRAIQTFDPGLIPIWRIQRWLFPGESRPRTLVHHGIGRYFPFPRYVRRPFFVMMPWEPEHRPPNFLDAIFEDTSTVSYRMGGPGEYMPWDWSVYRFCRANFERITSERYKQILEARRARKEREHEAFVEEFEYSKKQIEPWILKQLEKVSDSDWDQLLSFHAENDKRRAKGLKPIRRNPPKAFVRIKEGMGKMDKGAPAGIPLLEGPGRSPRPDKETYGRVAPAQVRE